MTNPCKKEKVSPVQASERTEVRVSLAVFAMTNFLIGMAVFMFTMCSSAPHHIQHLRLLFTDFPALIEHFHENEAENTHSRTAH